MEGNQNMKSVRQAALALALAGAAATAQAGIKASAINTYWLSPSAAQSLVLLDASGATTLSFTLAGAGKKVLAFSAVCSVRAPAGDYLSWVDLDIVVNGVVVAPTVGNDDAFCSANGTLAYDDYVRATITIPIQGVAGNNTIQVKARGNYNTMDMHFVNPTLVVFD
jgi:hypothetical protein